MGINFVGGSTVYNGTGAAVSSLALTYYIAATGYTYIVGVACTAPSSEVVTATIADDKGNTWVLDATNTNYAGGGSNPLSVFIFRTSNPVTGTGLASLIVTFNVPVLPSSVSAIFSGMAFNPIRQVAYNQGSFTNTQPLQLGFVSAPGGGYIGAYAAAAYQNLPSGSQNWVGAMVSYVANDGTAPYVFAVWATDTIGGGFPYALTTTSYAPYPLTSPLAAVQRNNISAPYATSSVFAITDDVPLYAEYGPVISDGWLYVQEPGGVGLVDRSSYLFNAEGKHSFDLQMRQRGKASYTLVSDPQNPLSAPAGYTPTMGQPIWLQDRNPTGTQIVFSGLVQDYTVRYVGITGLRYIDVTAVSFESCFDTVFVSTPVQYVNQSPEYIFTDLFNRFETGCMVSLGTVGTSGVTIPLFNPNIGDKISDLFDQLATTAQFIWGVNPQTGVLYFQAPTATAAPFSINSTKAMWDSINIKYDNADYRNRQAVKLSYDAFSHSMEYFAGSGQKTITLARPVSQVVNAYITLSTCNTATGSFAGGQPANGDTVTIQPANGAWAASHVYTLGGVVIVNGYTFAVTTAGTSGGSAPSWNYTTGATTTDNSVIWTCKGPSGLSTGVQTYTFVNTLDNTQFGQVLIGATATATCQNLADAINRYIGGAIGRGPGVNFSLPTWENFQCNAISVSGTGFTLQQKAAGSGWVASLSTTSSNFAWSAAQTSGGTSPQGTVGPNQPATITIQVYVQGTSTAAPGVAYTPGSNVVTLATPLNSGTNLNIEYTRPDGDVIQVENTLLVQALAATSTGLGEYQQSTDQSNQGLIATSAAAGLQLGQQIIQAFGVTPQELKVELRQPGLLPGQELTLSLNAPLDTLNGTYFIQEINGELVPVDPWMDQSQVPGGGHYRYTATLISVTEIQSWLGYWQGLAGGGSGGGGAGSGIVPTSGGAQSTNPGQAGVSSPLTTKGDVYVYGTGPVRLPVGSDGQVLVSRSSATNGVDWEATPLTAFGPGAGTYTVGNRITPVTGNLGKITVDAYGRLQAIQEAT